KGCEIEGYRIIRDLGEGPYSKTFLAYQKSVDRTVVLKLFSIIQDYDMNTVFNDFKNAFFKIAATDDPKLMHYFDCGIYSRYVFMSMPYMSEGTVRDMIRRGKIPPEKALSIMSGVADALNSMLKLAGAVHLSINPSNVMPNDNGVLLVTDYGLKLWKSKYCKKNDCPENWARYDSPELKEGEAVGYLSDIYSTGVLLSEMLSGTLSREKTFNPDYAIKMSKASGEISEIIRTTTEPSKDMRVQSYDALIRIIDHARKQFKKTSAPVKTAIKAPYQPRKIVIKKKS
ncbi:MAG TPA: protein kinase, partial [Victivallales bacterium]|nr:protein kinase [Victivallales bacterium]